MTAEQSHHQGPLHAMDPLGRFSQRADDYARYRPTYPDGAISAILDGLGDLARLVAADVGAGTGISARLLASRGVRVIAIEPNEAMRKVAEAHPGVEWRGATAERTGLADGSVDVVVCAQAFHWFEPGAALTEFRRILRPGGRLALVWNDRDLDDPATAGYSRLIREASRNHPAESSHVDAGALQRSELFKNVHEVVVPHRQELDEDGLVGRALSASYVPKSGGGRDRLAAGLRELHARLADEHGMVALAYWTRVFLAEAPGATTLGSCQPANAGDGR